MARHFSFSPWRRAFQWSLTALVAIIPFVNSDGGALLRLNIPTLTLELAGHRFRIEELYLVWLFALALIFLFILITLILGRVWCGWVCPQTALSDTADWLNRHKHLRPLRHLGFILISLWAGATFVWYFMPPAQYLTLLVSGKLGVWPVGTTLVITGLIMVDLLFIRRLFCQDFCPYGRFQTILLDKGTLTLQAPQEELHRCIDCKSCLRICPTGIDI
ncbi:MAG: 4Fe-4S binding protein, partial [Desulfobulbaceae bacterium]|nr:4Fe-4S binding protein [Desulfobulbaceae bacterium]